MSAEAVIRVLLTEGQRARVKDLTGRDMETLELADPVGIQGERMPIVRPDDIEILAIQEARRLNDEEDAERKWLEGLAAEQDAEAKRLKELEAIQKDTAKEVKKEQKRQQAEFKLLAAGKKTPRQIEKEAKQKAARKGRRGS